MRISSRSRIFLAVATLLPLAFIGLVDLNKFVDLARSTGILGPRMIERHLSISLAGTDCIWTNAQPLGQDVDPYGTLFASYPGSGMRIMWQQSEGLSGIQVGDDFYLGGTEAYDKTGIVKTQYPHIEGIWTYQDNINQVIMLIRNPRYAMPQYHHFLYEIDYAHDWDTAYEFINNTFTTLSPIENWIKWRDYRFDDELNLWGWFIDFWMYEGRQYWITWDFERNGQWPFRFLNETEREYTYDEHCDFVNETCKPKAILSFEKLRDPEFGPNEIRKIADNLRGKRNMTVLDDDKMVCIYHQTNINHPMPNETNRVDPDGSDQVFNFTFGEQHLYAMLEKLDSLINRYNGTADSRWIGDPLAAELVEILEGYVGEIQIELNSTSFSPTSAPGVNYTYDLVQWYNSLGKGNRYDKGKVQALAYFWGNNSFLFANETNPYTNETYNATEGGFGASSGGYINLTKWGNVPPWWDEIPDVYIFPPPTPAPVPTYAPKP